MRFMTIGEFAERTRLSPKALRLYDELKLVVPARVDAGSGYRRYAEEQVEPARLVGQLRRAGMPLALISSVLAMDGADASRALAGWWQQVEAATAGGRAGNRRDRRSALPRLLRRGQRRQRWSHGAVPASGR